MSAVQEPVFIVQSTAAYIRELEEQVENYQARELEVKVNKPILFEGEYEKLRSFLAQLDMFIDI